MNAHNDFEEAKRQLDREFTGDKDFEPKVSWFRRHFTLLAFRNLAMILGIAGIVITVCTLVCNNVTKDRNTFEALHLPACDNAGWVSHTNPEGSRWFDMERGNYTVQVNSAGTIWLNDIRVITGSDHVTHFYNCIASAQVAKFSSLKQ
jgi:hypothetical protein